MTEKKAWILTILITLAALSCRNMIGPEGSESARSLDDRSEIRQLIGTAWREHIEAAGRKDLAGVLAMHTDDIVYVIAGQSETRGITALEEVERSNLASADLVAAQHTTDSLQVFGDTAFEIGTIAGPVRPKGGETQTVVFHFMARWRRGGQGIWKVSYLVGETEE